MNPADTLYTYITLENGKVIRYNTEKITYQSKVSLENFLTYALQQIFTDRNYEIKFNLKEETKKPGLELMLVENGVEQEITDAVGGGILSTLGLLLQIYYIEKHELNKIMFIDEGLKELSSTKLSESEDKSYLENLLTFIKWLAKEKNYKFILVTHDQKVREFADKVYEVKKGVVAEC
jgi:DNA repair exonuclease SbcCD ATPase subunit